MASTRQIIPRLLGGADRSRQSHSAKPGALYDLLQLRPFRGQLIQTRLIGSFVDDVGDIISIVPPSELGEPDQHWDWVEFEEPSFSDPFEMEMDNWTAFDDPSFGPVFPMDMDLWTGQIWYSYGDPIPLDMASWTGQIWYTYGDEIEMDMANWTDGGL